MTGDKKILLSSAATEFNDDDDDDVGKRQTASKQDGMRCDGGHE